MGCVWPQILHSIQVLLGFVLHIQSSLPIVIGGHGPEAYIIMAIIVFTETGLVFLPFLPGDTLLFLAGSFVAVGALSVPWLVSSLVLAAVLGDTVNYWIGHFLGTRIIEHPRMTYVRKHNEVARRFYEKHGGKTVILARFVPYIRSFAPFVAGAERMRYGRFLAANISGAILWVIVVLSIGYFFGNIPFVKNNFGLFMILILPTPLVPVLITWLRRKLPHKRPG